MPLKKDDLDRRGDLPTGEWRETDDVPVGDMVYHLAESIANSQTKLDLNAAEVAKTLDETEVEVVPRIVQRVDEDGNVTTERDDPVKRTLLEIGFTPSRYHFSEATIEVDFDTKMSEESETDTESNVGMRAGTSEARQHRKYNRSVETNTHVKAKLEPMVPPTGLTPERTTLPARPDDADGADEGADDDSPGGGESADSAGEPSDAAGGDADTTTGGDDAPPEADAGADAPATGEGGGGSEDADPGGAGDATGRSPAVVADGRDRRSGTVASEPAEPAAAQTGAGGRGSPESQP